jgi:purine-binding chemotaxis protein CheW
MTARKLLLFRTGGRVFALAAGAVREILPASASTRIPGAPAPVRGLVNVRGTLVTVVDAAEAIGLEATPVDWTENGAGLGTLVLVDYASRPVGLVVDDVLDLVTVSDAELTAGGEAPGIRPGLLVATGEAGGERFVQLATDALLQPLLA